MFSRFDFPNVSLARSVLSGFGPFSEREFRRRVARASLTKLRLAPPSGVVRSIRPSTPQYSRSTPQNAKVESCAAFFVSPKALDSSHEHETAVIGEDIPPLREAMPPKLRGLVLQESCNYRRRLCSGLLSAVLSASTTSIHTMRGPLHCQRRVVMLRFVHRIVGKRKRF